MGRFRFGFAITGFTEEGVERGLEWVLWLVREYDIFSIYLYHIDIFYFYFY